jgi:hypothetical protein
VEVRRRQERRAVAREECRRIDLLLDGPRLPHRGNCHTGELSHRVNCHTPTWVSCHRQLRARLRLLPLELPPLLLRVDLGALADLLPGLEQVLAVGVARPPCSERGGQR